jgi:hypothetical protein
MARVMRLAAAGKTVDESAAILGLKRSSIVNVRYEAHVLIRTGRVGKRWRLKKKVDVEGERAARITEWNIRRDIRAGERCARCWLLGHVARECDQCPEVVVRNQAPGYEAA